ncbi:MAG: cytochrome c biogenesis CcdA family protein, partial [Ktedonobacterales bacterium]
GETTHTGEQEKEWHVVELASASVTFLGAFAAGLLSFVSPCVLPLTPIYLAQLVVPAVLESAGLTSAERARLRFATILHAAAFVAGFTVTFIALGATASVLGSYLFNHQVALRRIGGVVLVLFGLHVVGLVRLPWLNREKRLGMRVGRASYPASFLVGLIFALGWTPCVGPILAGILLLAAQSQTLATGVGLLAVYSLGLGVPFLALGAAFDKLTPALKRLTPHMRLIEGVTGALLILMGVVIFFNWLLIINGWFPTLALG